MLITYMPYYCYNRCGYFKWADELEASESGGSSTSGNKSAQVPSSEGAARPYSNNNSYNNSSMSNNNNSYKNNNMSSMNSSSGNSSNIYGGGNSYNNTNRYNGSQDYNSNKLGGEGVGGPQCLCGSKAKTVITKKEGVNFGREFYTCPNKVFNDPSKPGCNYFKFFDEYVG